MAPTALKVLTVCTANICRSPVAEAVFRREFALAGISAVVRSAGTHGGVMNVAPEVVRAGAEIGIDVSSHQSRLLTGGIVRSADLIVTMTREHLRHVVDLDPDSFLVTFTLKEIARRSVPFVPRSLTFDEWVLALNEHRLAIDLLGASDEDDLADPYGGSYSGYQAMVAEVDRLVTVRALVT